MIGLGAHTAVYLVLGATDMRKSIDGLAGLVQQGLGADPFADAVFVFCNRGGDKLKILHWDHNGFWLYYRRLERGRFRWPREPSAQGRMCVSRRELGWLLDGLDIRQPIAHRPLKVQIAA